MREEEKDKVKQRGVYRERGGEEGGRDESMSLIC